MCALQVLDMLIIIFFIFVLYKFMFIRSTSCICILPPFLPSSSLHTLYYILYSAISAHSASQPFLTLFFSVSTIIRLSSALFRLYTLLIFCVQLFFFVFLHVHISNASDFLQSSVDFIFRPYIIRYFIQNTYLTYDSISLIRLPSTCYTVLAAIESSSTMAITNMTNFAKQCI